jgi:uncharacterized membrane protein
MEDFREITITLMCQMGFTPIVLIGLLIATLSLILNLKTTNIYIQNFLQHENKEKFINLIFYTSFVLILMIGIAVLSKYFLNEYIQLFFSISYLMLLCFVLYSLFTIVFILQRIVKNSF